MVARAPATNRPPAVGVEGAVKRSYWWVRQFDQSWVRCRNTTCKAEFVFRLIKGKRKCPKCKMDNALCLPKP